MHGFRRLMSLAVALLVGASLMGGCGKDLTPAEHVVKAKEFMDKGEYRAAFIELSNAAEKDPNSMESRWLLAKLALDLGDGARAEKEARKALELGQSKAAVQPMLAQTLLLQANLDGVLKETDPLAEGLTEANKAQVLGLRGQALIVKGQLDQAKSVLAQALQMDANAHAALIGMTALHGFRREFDEARRWVGLALKAGPNSPEAWSAMGDLEMAQGNPAKAEEAFGKAIQFRHFTNMDTAKRALARIQLKKFKEAEADLQALKAQGYDKHPYVSYLNGLNHFMQKRYAQAADAFAASHAANPEFLPNRLYLASTYQLLGQHEKALLYAQRVEAEAPRSMAVKRLLGSIQISRSEYDAAKAVLEGALAKAPDDISLLNMMATVYMLEGDASKGLEYTSRMAALLPQSAETQERLLMAKLLAGKPIDDQIRQSAALAASHIDAYTGELLLALQSFRNKHLAETLERAGKLHQRYPDKIEPLNLMAASHILAGQWDKARQALDKVLKIRPLEPSATYNLAKIEALRGNPKRARDLLLPLVKAQPANAHAVILLADVEGRLGNPAAAMPLLEQAVQKNPASLDARARLAVEYLRMGNVQKVLEITQGLSDGQMKSQQVLLEMRGKAQLLSGDAAAARRTFELWTRLAQTSAPARYYHATSLAQSGDVKAGRKALEQALKLDPRYLPARVGEIRMLVHFEELEGARKALARLRQDFGDRPEVLGIEGWYALGNRDYAGAEKSLAAALGRNPDIEVAILMIRAQWEQKKYNEAMKFMQSWLKDRPKDLTMLMYMAGAYLSLNRNEEARATYAKVVEHYPRHVPALNNLAWLSSDKDLDQAIQYAQRAQQVAPQDPYVMDTLGMLMLKRGDTVQGYKLIRDAAGRAPTDVQIQLHLGQVLVKQARHAEARKVLNNVVIMAPNSSHANEARTLLSSMGGAGSR